MSYLWIQIFILGGCWSLSWAICIYRTYFYTCIYIYILWCTAIYEIRYTLTYARDSQRTFSKGGDVGYGHRQIYLPSLKSTIFRRIYSVVTELDTLLWWMLKAAKLQEKPWTFPTKAGQFSQTCSTWLCRLPTPPTSPPSCRWSPSSAFCRIRTCYLIRAQIKWWFDMGFTVWVVWVVALLHRVPVTQPETINPKSWILFFLEWNSWESKGLIVPWNFTQLLEIWGN